MADDVKCPYCSSKDLSKIPAPAGASSTSITYKCQMCHRTFSKSSSEKSKEE